MASPQRPPLLEHHLLTGLDRPPLSQAAFVGKPQLTTARDPRDLAQEGPARLLLLNPGNPRTASTTRLTFWLLT